MLTTDRKEGYQMPFQINLRAKVTGKMSKQLRFARR